MPRIMFLATDAGARRKRRPSFCVYLCLLLLRLLLLLLLSLLVLVYLLIYFRFLHDFLFHLSRLSPHSLITL